MRAVSLVPPDPRDAAHSRCRLREAVCDDMARVLSHAARTGVLANAEAAALSVGLGAARSQAASELFQSHFRILEAFESRDFGQQRRALLLLGGMLSCCLEAGDGPDSLPVLIDKMGCLVLLGAAPHNLQLAVNLDSAGGLPIQERARLRSDLLAAVDSTWIRRSTSRIQLRGLTLATAREIMKYQKETSRLSGEDVDLQVASPPELGDLIDRFDEATSLLATVDPVMLEELNELTEYVVPLSGTRFVGGSDIELFGASFLRLLPDWSPLSFADHLLHEAAHQRLHAHDALQPILQNGTSLDQSPIRGDLRPLIGVLHATYVFLRLASFMAKAAATLDAKLGREAEIRYHHHLIGLLQGIQVLQSRAELTTTGKLHFDEWVSAAQNLARDQAPDTELARRLTWDYPPARNDLPLSARPA